MIRYALLKASENPWFRRNAGGSSILRRSVRRFLPGESLEEALAACRELTNAGIATVLTYLGESIRDRREAQDVADHYRIVLERVSSSGLPTEISIKLTQLGLDLDAESCFANVSGLPVAASSSDSTIWIDMEQSSYVGRTLEVVRRARWKSDANVGVCVQAYLRRSERDIQALLASGTAIRLVKGAYAEGKDVAFAKKREVDENYLHLARMMLSETARRKRLRAAFATHDRALIERITRCAESMGLRPIDFEFQMLYGIQRELQNELVRRGHRVRVLISYGSSWFPWFMRRLAERPANLLFVLRNVLVK